MLCCGVIQIPSNAFYIWIHTSSLPCPNVDLTKPNLDRWVNASMLMMTIDGICWHKEVETKWKRKNCKMWKWFLPNISVETSSLELMVQDLVKCAKRNLFLPCPMPWLEGENSHDGCTSLFWFCCTFRKSSCFCCQWAFNLQERAAGKCRQVKHLICLLSYYPVASCGMLSLLWKHVLLYTTPLMWQHLLSCSWCLFYWWSTQELWC